MKIGGIGLGRAERESVGAAGDVNGDGFDDVVIVARFGDAWPDRCCNPFDPGAKRDHRCNGLIGHACRCSAPAGMGRRHAAAGAVAKQRRQTIGGHHGTHHACAPGNGRRSRWCCTCTRC